MKLRFPNGYALSIIEDGYGLPDAPYEIAVMHGNELVYDTGVTGDVVGWLTATEVLEYGAKVAALPTPDARMIAPAIGAVCWLILAAYATRNRKEPE